MITPDLPSPEQTETAFSSKNLAAQAETVNVDPLRGAEELPETFFTADEMGNLLLAAQKMADYVAATNKVVYLKLSGGNLIISAAISPDQAVQNFRKSVVKQSREKLGMFWSAAEEKYNELAKKIFAMTAEQRLQLLKDFNAQRNSVKDFGAITSFINMPTLDLAMDLAGELPGSNVAEQLTSLVERISALLPQQ